MAGCFGNSTEDKWKEDLITQEPDLGQEREVELTISGFIYDGEKEEFLDDLRKLCDNYGVSFEE